MGSWGSGTLENDSAQDFFASIIEAEEYMEGATKETLSKILFAEIQSTLDEEDDSYTLLAVCEAIAATLGKHNPQLDSDYLELCLSIKNQITVSQINKAKELLQGFIEYDEKDSESWNSLDQHTEWIQNLKELKQRLS